MLEATCKPETGTVCLNWEMSIGHLAALDIALISAVLVLESPSPEYREKVVALQGDTAAALNKLIDREEAANGRHL